MTNSIREIEVSEAFLIIGSNTTENHPVIASMIKKAVISGGKKLVVVDPRKIEMARYADVISSMFYPSHFPQAFYGTLPYNQKAKEIYYQGSNRTYLLAGGNIHSRPYVQAFLMGPELQKDTPEYQDYLVKQLQGVKESRGNGFLLWNNSNRYYMVPSSLRAYTGLPQFHGEVLD